MSNERIDALQYIAKIYAVNTYFADFCAEKRNFGRLVCGPKYTSRMLRQSRNSAVGTAQKGGWNEQRGELWNLAAHLTFRGPGQKTNFTAN